MSTREPPHDQDTRSQAGHEDPFAPGTPSPSGDEAEALVSPLLIEAGLSHGFFTRRGGVSPPPWDTLSFSAAQGDDPARVRENRRRAARRLGVPERSLHYLSQVHGIDVLTLRGDEDPDDVVRAVGDITLSRTPGVACGVRSADCVPILLGDRHTGAVAAVHSGWKGTTLRVAMIGVERLRELAGGRTSIVAAIGPCISACCFEVGEDVAALLAKASSAGDTALSWGPPSEKVRARTHDAAPTRQVGREGEGEPDDPRHRKPHVDLRKIVRAQLIESGLSPADIEDVPGCTACDPERFHSYRRDGAASGRLLSAIVSMSK
jgi:YfiH family protein